MSVLLEIDRYQRKIISILFRILIILYSIFLLLYNDTIFIWYVNLTVFVTYVSLYLVLLKNNIWLSRLRLLNDYAFIAYILYQLPSIDIFSYSLLFAPILNTHNHSGNKKSLLLYLYPIVILFFINDKFNLWLIVPFLLFLLINTFDNLRSKYFRFQQKLNTIIDDFFIDDEMVNRPYKIYKPVIKVLNTSNLLSASIADIICLKIENNKVFIINGSSFIWNLRINNTKSFLIKLEKKPKLLHNIKITIDNKVISKNIISVCSIDSHLYCFVLLPVNDDDFLRLPFSIFVNKFISPIFHRISNVIDSDYKQKKNEQNKLYELEKKITYVSNSSNAMHFIRNKLGPLTVYLEMFEDFDNAKDEETKNKIGLYLQNERLKLSSSLHEIVKRADYILSKSNNPFNVINVKKHGIQQLYSEIKRIWNYHLVEENFIFNWHISRQTYDVEYNNIGLGLVLTNWISNIFKFNNGFYQISFDESEELYCITFSNSFDTTKTNTTDFVNEFMSSDKIEISRRKSHGLIEVKDFLEQMKIGYNLSIQGENIVLVLEFKKINHDESTYI